MQVRIADHWGFFGDVVALKGSGNFETAAMPGVDGSFSAVEGVWLVDS